MLRWALCAALALALCPVEAGAVVYCKTVGVPQGCVARPAAGVGVGARGVGVAPGVGVGARGVGVAPGVGLGSPGVGVSPRAGTANRGGPVNRAGVR
jgi:hypothetical protein